MDPHDYCQEKAAASGSSFYYSFLVLPDEQRRAITALYAFCREVDDVVDECSDHGLARTKLAWWREEIDRAFRGAPQHPVARALQPHLEAFDLPEEYFVEVIDGMEMDLDTDRYSTYKELRLYCHRAAGVVGLLSAEIFGYTERSTLKYAHELGIAFQLTNIIRDVREDARRGRVYIPEDELERFGVGRSDLLQSHTPERVRALMRFQAGRARECYAHAFGRLPDADRYRQRSGLIMAEIYLRLLEEMEREDFSVLEHKLALTPVRKAWIAWRTERRERRRRPAGRATGTS
ncbi:MAG: presqualene diphosphate synthase HpnD [Gammaproteobacteria bacterium]|nr:presqualene diphosphate synthase HpnD [Gammaproteobacteria bacterium]